jgi:hypothetical protein
MNTQNVFVVLYIHSDVPDYSEVLGLFKNKEDAVKELLERANYREKDGQLTQYLQPTDEYESYSFLKNKVNKEMVLYDQDVYKIQSIPLV